MKNCLILNRTKNGKPTTGLWNVILESEVNLYRELSDKSRYWAASLKLKISFPMNAGNIGYSFNLSFAII